MPNIVCKLNGCENQAGLQQRYEHTSASLQIRQQRFGGHPPLTIC